MHGGENVRFFARLDVGTASATLIRRRHPMPSCGGLTANAEIAEGLTSDPGVREQNRHTVPFVTFVTLHPVFIALLMALAPYP